ncbi:hypothetical protein H7K45_16075 [Mycobacterium yunnanensis]|uniref:DoxX-like family protein n=1 Tax=Mycobacterium yunnanensis TaxID=368477 RepID=A0A9X2Z2H5_9MYCO|nr:hypothetical protein [Mycobacterium yunnanensis]MCV7422069.1 hypothetical protein [Mycobacterium yunnanensis]
MSSLTASSENTASQVTAQRMGATLIGMGVLHFVAPKPFDTIVPAELPGTPRFYTLASGVAEVTTGALLIAPRTRRVGALAAVALYVGVFPANVNSVRVLWNKGWPARIGTIARLPLQIPMITKALKVYRTAPR